MLRVWRAVLPEFPGRGTPPGMHCTILVHRNIPSAPQPECHLCAGVCTPGSCLPLRVNTPQNVFWVLPPANSQRPAASATGTGTGGQCPALPAGACQPPVERAIAMSLATWSGCGRHTTRSPRPCAVEHQHGVLCTMYLPADSIWVVCRCVRNPEIHLDMLAVSQNSAVVCANDGSAWKLQPYPATWVRVHPPSALFAPDGSRGAAAVAAA